MDRLITTKEAVEIAESWGFPMTRQTVLAWSKKYRLGRKMAGTGLTSPYYIDHKRWLVALKGLRERDEQALRLLERWQAERVKNEKRR